MLLMVVADFLFFDAITDNVHWLALRVTKTEAAPIPLDFFINRTLIANHFSLTRTQAPGSIYRSFL